MQPMKLKVFRHGVVHDSRRVEITLWDRSYGPEVTLSQIRHRGYDATPHFRGGRINLTKWCGVTFLHRPGDTTFLGPYREYSLESIVSCCAILGGVMAVRVEKPIQGFGLFGVVRRTAYRRLTPICNTTKVLRTWSACTPGSNAEKRRGEGSRNGLCSAGARSTGTRPPISPILKDGLVERHVRAVDVRTSDENEPRARQVIVACLLGAGVCRVSPGSTKESPVEL